MPDALIVADAADVFPALALAARLGARVLLKSVPDAVAPADIPPGAKLYVPPELSARFPDARVAIFCPLTGQPLFSLLRRHRLRFGARAAAVFHPGALRASLRPGCPAVLSPADLREISGQARFSPACVCAYTLARAENGLDAVLFDAEKTLSRRVALCKRLGVEGIVLCG